MAAGIIAARRNFDLWPPLAAWGLTRAIIFLSMWFAAAHHLVRALGNWDGAWYGSIAIHGYGAAPDAHGHSSYAFFPLFPLLGSLVMRAHVPWPLGGALVNNAAFLGAIVLLYRYLERRAGVAAARWSAIIACMLPYSLFASVAYSEGLFLCCSAAALYAYDRQWYAAAGIWAALASLTRPLGVILACALVVAAALERRGRAVALCALGAFGILSFMLFCVWNTHDAFAFIHAQQTWRKGVGFDWASWWAQMRRDFTSVDLNVWRADGMLWLLLIAGSAAVFFARARLGTAAVIFAAGAVVALLLSGTPYSVDRNLYSLVPILAALGIAAARFPVAGMIGAAVCLPWLAADAAAFARFAWVAFDAQRAFC